MHKSTLTCVERHHSIGEHVNGDGGANDLLHVRADDRHLGHDPKEDARQSGVATVAQLRQVLPRDDAQSGGENLHQQAEDGGGEQHPQQLVVGHHARLQVRLNVARVEVGDGHQEAGPGEGPQATPAKGVLGSKGKKKKRLVTKTLV